MTDILHTMLAYDLSTMLHLILALGVQLVHTLNAMTDDARYTLMASPEWPSIVRVLRMIGAVVWEDGSVQLLQRVQ